MLPDQALQADDQFAADVVIGWLDRQRRDAADNPS
jgi:hypothetical protein